MLLSCIRMIRAFAVKLRDDSVSAFAAHAAFFIILSFFPFVMFLLTLLNYLPISVSDLQRMFSDFLPKNISDTLYTIFSELMNKASGTILSIIIIITNTVLFPSPPVPSHKPNTPIPVAFLYSYLFIPLICSFILASATHSLFF